MSPLFDFSSLAKWVDSNHKYFSWCRIKRQYLIVLYDDFGSLHKSYKFFYALLNTHTVRYQAHPVIKLVICASGGRGFPNPAKNGPVPGFQRTGSLPVLLVDTYDGGVGSPAGLWKFLRGHVGNYVSRLQNDYGLKQSIYVAVRK